MIDIARVRKIFFVGIKGVGLSSLAIFAKDMGKEVSGSDVGDVFITDKALKRKKIPVFLGFDFKVPKDVDLVVYSVSHGGRENRQVKEAAAEGIAVLNYAQALNLFMRGKKVLAVAGTHGKTTTASMLAKILKDAGFKPSWVIGAGRIKDLNFNGCYSSGEYAVVEADEYVDEPGGVPKFLRLNPFGVIITAVDWDHPDVFESLKRYQNAFKKLLKRTSEKGVAVLDDSYFLRKIAKGFKGKVRFVTSQSYWRSLKLLVFGDHNQTNACFAAAMAHEVGVEAKIIKKSIQSFRGLQRRLEYKGKFAGAELFDDYAHHPQEIKSAISALKNKYPRKKLTVVFQPHTYSRTDRLVREFVSSLVLADRVYITPTFSSARERKSKGDKDLAAAVNKIKPLAVRVENPDDLKRKLSSAGLKGGVLVTMGAGDVYKWLD